jgi:hypothetical protein
MANFLFIGAIFLLSFLSFYPPRYILEDHLIMYEHTWMNTPTTSGVGASSPKAKK